MSKTPEKRTPNGERVAVVGLAVVAAVCGGVFLLFGTAGVGAVLAIAFSPWALVPTAVVLVGIVAWYGNRRYRLAKDVADNAEEDQETVGA